MFRSLQTSNLLLRIGLAVVFLWLGSEKILGPDMWATEWLSGSVREGVLGLGMSPRDPVLLAAILEILVGMSLISGYFVRAFTGIGIALLIVSVLLRGPTTEMIGIVGLISALLALMMWPERSGWHT